MDSEHKAGNIVRHVVCRVLKIKLMIVKANKRIEYENQQGVDIGNSKQYALTMKNVQENK